MKLNFRMYVSRGKGLHHACKMPWAETGGKVAMQFFFLLSCVWFKLGVHYIYKHVDNHTDTFIKAVLVVLNPEEYLPEEHKWCIILVLKTPDWGYVKWYTCTSACFFVVVWLSFTVLFGKILQNSIHPLRSILLKINKYG